MQRSKGLALMFVLGALLTGAVLGFSADRMLLRDSLCAKPGERHGWRDRFTEQVGLTTAQRAAMDSILEDKHAQIDALLAPMRPQLDSISANAREQIKRQLTPEQQVKFDEFRQQRKSSKESGK